MLARRFAIPFMLLFAVLGLAGALYAQLETSDRGELPLDSSNTLEIGGVHVDVGAADAQSARYAGWRMAQRQGFKLLWAKMHNSPIAQAPSLPDGTLDEIVSSINVEREQIGPTRYIADLGVQFDRSKAAAFLGVEGIRSERSVPMLLIPIIVTGGTSTTVETRNAWQHTWAQFRTAQSAIDYVRISGMNADPMLLNAAQTARPGRGWWRALLEMYGASDILIAEVQLQRLYPGGPARARFIARHGPDNEIVGGFTLTAANGDAIPAMLAQGAQRIDQLFGQALASGRLSRDPSLDLPPPPAMPSLAEAKPGEVSPVNAFQIQVTGKNVNFYNFAMAHLRRINGIESATPQQINASGTSYILVQYKGDIAQLAAALSTNGWIVDAGGSVIKIRSDADKPPALPPPPPAVQPPPSTAPATPAQPTSNQATPRQ